MQRIQKTSHDCPSTLDIPTVCNRCNESSVERTCYCERHLGPQHLTMRARKANRLSKRLPRRQDQRQSEISYLPGVVWYGSRVVQYAAKQLHVVAASKP